ncbi:MAG: hypothetical protein HQL51_12285 [Magnetococcales bacterium]|nr:hypothetical protein [Magnetococcales bacterium]
MKRSRALWAALGLAVGGVVFFSLAILPNLDAEPYRARLLAVAQRITHHPITLDGLRFTFSGGPTLRLINLKILSNHPDDPPLLTVREVDVGVGLEFFLSPKSIALSSVRLLNPEVHLVLREETPLFALAQATARQGGEGMEKELGLGLAEISIGKVAIRDGLLTVTPPSDSSLPGLVFERVQMELQGVAPGRPAGLTASARLQSLPFNLSGQIGPMPASLDLTRLPLLINVDARTPDLHQLLENFAKPGAGLRPRAVRGTFSTLIHGSLADGLNTSSWLQMDQLTFSRSSAAAPSPLAGLLAVAQEKRPDFTPMDLAMRQKSSMRLKQFGPHWRLQEMFLYLDGAPVLEAKGDWMDPGWVEMFFTLTGGVALDRFPKPDRFPFTLGEVPSGQARLIRKEVGPLTAELDLDLTRTRVVHPPLLEKRRGTALRAQAELVWMDQTWRLASARVKPEPEGGEEARIVAAPDGAWTATGQWAGERLASYFPQAVAWEPEGMTRFTLSGNGAPGEDGRVEGEAASGGARVGEIPLKEAAFRFRQTSADTVSAPWFHGRIGEGIVEGSALIRGGDEPLYRASFQAEGVLAEKLPPPLRQGWTDVEGVMAVRGRVWGGLSGGMALSPTGGWVEIRSGPGRLQQFDPAPLLTPPPEEGRQLSHPERALYWREGEVSWLFHDGRAEVEGIHLRHGPLTLVGRGRSDASGESFHLRITPGDVPPREVRLLREEGVWHLLPATDFTPPSGASNDADFPP